jgi:hypothetical protein
MKNFFSNSPVRFTLISLLLIFLIVKAFTSSSFGNFMYSLVWVLIFLFLVNIFFEIQERKSKKLPKKTPYLRVVDEHSVNERKDFLVYEMYNKDADFKTLFGSLSSDLKSLSFDSRDEIKKFALENKQSLQIRSCPTFFLFAEIVDNREKFFVARVDFLSNAMYMERFCLLNDYVWNSSSAYRFVVPVAKPLDTQS